MEYLENLVATAHAGLDDTVRESLWKRGVSDTQIAAYRLGGVGDEIPGLEECPEAFQSWVGRHRDALRDAFVLPMTNVLNQVKGVQFRSTDQAQRGYLTYPGVEDEVILVGLGPAMAHVWRTRSVILVEGGFDIFPVQRVFPEVVSTQTARVTESFARILSRIVEDIWVLYDADKGGQRGTSEAVTLFQTMSGGRVDVHPLALPQPVMANGKRAKDPSDLWATWGDQRLGVQLRRLKDPLWSEGD